MIRSKTVLVLGAGASHEVGLPVGAKLAEQIAGNLKLVEIGGLGSKRIASREIYSAIRRLPRESWQVNDEAARIISEGISYAHSIDDFIDSFPDRPEIAQVGKISIAHAIINAERLSQLWVDPKNMYNKLSFLEISNSWYPILIRILSSGLKKAESNQLFDSVTFVSFNYDRCIEQFLAHALSLRFNLSMADAVNICADNPVLHPYGSLGHIDFSSLGSGRLSYGSNGSEFDLIAASKNIRTYTEQIDVNQTELSKIHSALSSAETILFIGFSFHEQNMNLLAPPKGISASRIFATTHGMSETDRVTIRNFLTTQWASLAKRSTSDRPTVVLSHQTCCDFFFDYQRTIAGN
jgi:SIR2-like domain